MPRGTGLRRGARSVLRPVPRIKPLVSRSRAPAPRPSRSRGSPPAIARARSRRRPSRRASEAGRSTRDTETPWASGKPSFRRRACWRRSRRRSWPASPTPSGPRPRRSKPPRRSFKPALNRHDQVTADPGVSDVRAARGALPLWTPRWLALHVCKPLCAFSSAGVSRSLIQPRLQ